MGRRTQHREFGDCSINSCPKATPLSFFLYVWLPQAVVSWLEPKVSTCKHLFLGPLRGCLGFQHPSFSLGWMKSLIFTASYYMDSSPKHWCFGPGSPMCGWDSLLLRGDICCWDILPDSQPPLVGVRQACFFCCCFVFTALPFSVWLLYILS